MRVKMPLMSRYQPTSRAKVPNVWNGDIKAMIPVTTNTAPSTACTHFHASANGISTSSLTPAAMSTKPAR